MNRKNITTMLLISVLLFSCNLLKEEQIEETKSVKDEFYQAYSAEITEVDGYARSLKGSSNLVDAVNKYYPQEAKLFRDTDYSKFEDLILQESKKNGYDLGDITVFDEKPLINEKFLHEKCFKQYKLMVENRDFFVRVELYYNFLLILQSRDILYEVSENKEPFKDRDPTNYSDRARVRSRLYSILKNSNDPEAVEYADAMFTIAHAMSDKIEISLVVGLIPNDMGPHDFDYFKEYIREHATKWIPGVVVQSYNLKQRVSMLTGYQAKKHGYLPENTMFLNIMKGLQVNQMRILWPHITDGI